MQWNDVISHEEQGPRGEFFIMRGGKRIAEMTYRKADGTLIVIDHTELTAACAARELRGAWSMPQWPGRARTRCEDRGDLSLCGRPVRKGSVHWRREGIA